METLNTNPLNLEYDNIDPETFKHIKKTQTAEPSIY